MFSVLFFCVLIDSCDGNRLYFDGCAMIVNNGEMLVQAQQFSLDDVEVISAVIDLTQIRDYRHIPSFGVQADAAKAFPVINVDFWMSDNNTTMKPAIPTIIRYHQFLVVFHLKNDIFCMLM